MGENSPAFDRVSIVTLTPSATFSIGCITFITHERNIGLPDPNIVTKGTMALPGDIGGNAGRFMPASFIRRNWAAGNFQASR